MEFSKNMKEPIFLHGSKTLPNGKPNHAFYEDLMETIMNMIPSNKPQYIETCINCNQEAHPMFNYIKQSWYTECDCLDDNVGEDRPTRQKAIIAWSVTQTIKKLEKEGVI